jgi:hypothetical protein
MQVTQLLHLGLVQRHLPHASAASADGEVEAQRASHHITVFISLTKLLYSVCIYSGGGSSSGRRFATLGGDDSDEGDDEPQNYFAGGERR